VSRQFGQQARPDAMPLPVVGDRHRYLVVERPREADRLARRAVARDDSDLPAIVVERVHPVERHARAAGHEALADRVDAEPGDEARDQLPVRRSQDTDLDHAAEINLLADKLT
jgi:hypothetical protein